MADPVTVVPVPRLDPDEWAWLLKEATEHPDEPLGPAITAVTQVHVLHMAGGCS